MNVARIDPSNSAQLAPRSAADNDLSRQADSKSSPGELTAKLYSHGTTKLRPVDDLVTEVSMRAAPGGVPGELILSHTSHSGATMSRQPGASRWRHKISDKSGLEPGTSWFRVEHAAATPHDPTPSRFQPSKPESSRRDLYLLKLQIEAVTWRRFDEFQETPNAGGVVGRNVISGVNQRRENGCGSTAGLTKANGGSLTEKQDRAPLSRHTFLREPARFRRQISSGNSMPCVTLDIIEHDEDYASTEPQHLITDNIEATLHQHTSTCFQQVGIRDLLSSGHQSSPDVASIDVPGSSPPGEVSGRSFLESDEASVDIGIFRQSEDIFGNQQKSSGTSGNIWESDEVVNFLRKLPRILRESEEVSIIQRKLWGVRGGLREPVKASRIRARLQESWGIFGTLKKPPGFRESLLDSDEASGNHWKCPDIKEHLWESEEVFGNQSL
ncbi:hypothetical protein Bbelb_230110 [Branchiostoma belcheri]|nr:hypothetical protein Bbelb_230110 [Branchiostoma belcheri]